MNSARAILLALALTLVAGSTAYAQEQGRNAPTERGAERKEERESVEKREAREKQEQKDLIYKALNLAILVGLIIYFLRKPATEFFTTRTASIQQGMANAAVAKASAEQRLVEMEQRLSHLSEEIAVIQADAAREDAVQAKRMTEAAQSEAVKIRTSAESEIETMTRAARLELKQYAAKLAVDLAEERVKAGMTPQAQAHLIETFVTDLNGGGKN